MSKITCKFSRIVWFDVKGHYEEGEGFPQMPRDPDEICFKFTDWMFENKIYSAVRGGMSGPGIRIIGLWPDDAEKALKWLEEQGVDITEFVHADEFTEETEQ